MPVDVLIVTALREEFVALQSCITFKAQHASAEALLTYQLAILPTNVKGIDYTIAATCLFGMGNTDAAILAAGAIRDLNPAYIIMFGLAGGIRGRVNLADVIVSNQLFYYEQAKLLPEGVPEIRPMAFRADVRLKIRMEHFASQGAKPYAVSFGPFAVGEKVVSDSTTIAALQKYEPKLLGIEMESFGVAIAASYAQHRPRFIAVRGVSDFADESKNDDWRQAALGNAANFIVEFLRTGALPLERISSEPDKAPKSLIAIHHLSLERRASITAAIETTLSEYVDYTVHEVCIDQTEFFQDGRLISPPMAFERQRRFLQEFDRLLHLAPDAQVGYFGLAHIPFMFHIGYQINRREVRVFATNRQTGEWVGLPRSSAQWPVMSLEGLPSSSSTTDGDVVLRVSVTAPVVMEQIHGVVDNPVASIHLTLGQPALDLVVNEDQLNSYALAFRRVLTDINHLLPNMRRIHLFFAGPPTLAFRCGQQISKTMDPEVVVYNYSKRDTPAYRWSLNLSTGQIVDRGVNLYQEQQS